MSYIASQMVCRVNLSKKKLIRMSFLRFQETEIQFSLQTYLGSFALTSPVALETSSPENEDLHVECRAISFYFQNTETRTEAISSFL